jgi:hypothetical protein
MVVSCDMAKGFLISDNSTMSLCMLILHNRESRTAGQHKKDVLERHQAHVRCLRQLNLNKASTSTCKSPYVGLIRSDQHLLQCCGRHWQVCRWHEARVSVAPSTAQLSAVLACTCALMKTNAECVCGGNCISLLHWSPGSWPGPAWLVLNSRWWP